MKNLHNKHSLKKTVFLTFASLTVGMLFFYTCLLTVLAFIVEDKVINQLLIEEGNYLQQEYERNNNGFSNAIKSRIYYIKVYQNITELPEELSQAIIKKDNKNEIFTNTEQHFHYRIVVYPNNQVIYLVAEVGFLLVVSNMSDDILLLMLLMFIVTFIISLWLTYIVSQRTIQPIIELSDAIKMFEVEHENTVLPYLDSKNELGDLARILSTSFIHLQNALKREADFTRDVGHELRTPLTIINNILALNHDTSFSKTETNELQQQAHHMNNTINVLMSLARAESLHSEKLSIKYSLEEAILALYFKIEENDFSIHLNIDNDVFIEVNKQLLALLFINLIDNALKYSCDNKLIITVTNEEKINITFENQCSKSTNNDAFNRTFKQENSLGIGQGLYLVKRIAKALNWQCFIEQNTHNFQLTLVIN